MNFLKLTLTIKMSTKVTMDPSGASASLRTESCTLLEVRMEQSKCGKIVKVHMGSGEQTKHQNSGVIGGLSKTRGVTYCGGQFSDTRRDS